MKTKKTIPHLPKLPDISENNSQKRYSPLNQVGMAGIETQIHLMEDGKKILPARVDIYVNLIDTLTRGIHMSRIYKILFDGLRKEKLSPKLIYKILKKSVSSQQGISSQAWMRVEFTLPLLCSSLLSGHHGIRHYPIVWEGEYSSLPKESESFTFSQHFQILYSSTCPCSTALSEDLQTKSGVFKKFVATPHAQRSVGDISLRYQKPPPAGFMTATIRKLEKAIKTPVQTTVKREDEQEFARLNAENQMFCEDAARILKQPLEQDNKISDYRIQVSHLESLHAHDAVAISVKGIPGGFTEKMFRG